MAKVLLVEDDNNLREIYEARLQAEGYEIASAQDGEQALVVAKQFMPDLIISDVMMPKISGFEMLDILRNTEGLEHTRVIMLTALSQAEDKSRADSLGADRYLVKSQVTLEDIIKAAHDILDPTADAPAPEVAAPSTTESGAPEAEAPAVSEPGVEAVPVATEPAPSTTPVEQPTAEPTTPAADNTPSQDVPVTPAPADEGMDAPSTPVDTAGTTVTDNSDTNNDSTPTATDQSPVATPTTPSSAPAPALSDDELLAEAASSLSKPDTSATPPAVEPAASAKPAIVAPNEPTPPTVGEAPLGDTTAPATPESDSSAGSSKRVIQPLTSQENPGPTLAELLAREEEKEAAAATQTPQIPDSPIAPADTPSESSPETPSSPALDNETSVQAEKPAPKKPDDFDPHDIAL